VVRWSAAALGLLLVAWLLTPTGRYLLRAAWEEGKILARRRPITEVIADPAADAALRAKLGLVLRARTFAEDSMRLRTGDSFTTFTRLERDTLVLVLSAAHRDELKRYTWWFPIVGRVPYKGFFDTDAARASRDALVERGFDAALRPASAFSTLGWFNDPLLSTTLRQDSLDLVNTVIHELTHNTFYAPGEAVFNESFANFVGARGAAWFFRAQGDSSGARIVEARWADEKWMGRFWRVLYDVLDSAFAAHRDDRGARLAAREEIYARARTRLVAAAGELRTMNPLVLERMRLDNATLLARRVYMTDLDLFDQVWRIERENLPATLARIISLARSNDDDPYAAVEQWVNANRIPAADSTARFENDGAGGAPVSVPSARRSDLSAVPAGR
jgi:predicted aminopeptidase